MKGQDIINFIKQIGLENEEIEGASFGYPKIIVEKGYNKSDGLNICLSIIANFGDHYSHEFALYDNGYGLESVWEYDDEEGEFVPTTTALWGKGGWQEEKVICNDVDYLSPNYDERR